MGGRSRHCLPPLLIFLMACAPRTAAPPKSSAAVQTRDASPSLATLLSKLRPRVFQSSNAAATSKLELPDLDAVFDAFGEPSSFAEVVENDPEWNGPGGVTGCDVEAVYHHAKTRLKTLLGEVPPVASTSLDDRSLAILAAADGDARMTALVYFSQCAKLPLDRLVENASRGIGPTDSESLSRARAAFIRKEGFRF